MRIPSLRALRASCFSFVARPTRTIVPAALAAACVAATHDLAASDARFAPVTRALQVNERTVSAEAAPTVLVADNGDFVVLYQGDDGDGTGIFGRAFLADGTPRPRGEFRINETRAGDQVLANAVSNGDGSFVVTWDGPDQGDVGTDVYVRTFDGTGAPRDAGETRVNQTTAWEQAGAYLAAAPDGDFVVVWRSDSADGNGSGVYCRAFHAEGTPKPGGERVLGTAGAGFDLAFGLGVDARGDFVVGWIERDDVESEGAVFTRAFFADGSPKDSGEQPAGGPRPGYVFAGQLDVNADGDFVVAWQNSLGPRAFARAYSSDGLPKRPNERRLSAVETRHEANPRVSIDATGGFVAAWQTDGLDGNDTEIYARLFGPDGEPAAETEFRVNASTAGVQSLQQLVRLARDHFVVAWTTAFSEDLRDDGAYLRSFDDQGEAKDSGEQRVGGFPTIDDGGTFLVRIVRAPGGGFIVVLGDGVPRFRPYDARGLPRSAVVQAGARGEPVTAAPAAMFDRDGDLAFVWADSRVNVQTYGGAHLVDVAVSVRTVGEPVSPGGTFRYILTASNEHPPAVANVGLANRVTLSVTLPDEVALLDLNAPGWACARHAAQLDCAADDVLGPGASSSIRLELRAPQAVAPVSTVATVTARQFDPDEGTPGSNNRVRIVTPICDPDAGPCGEAGRAHPNEGSD